MNNILSLRILGFSLKMKSCLIFIGKLKLYSSFSNHPSILQDEHHSILQDEHPSILRDEHPSTLKDEHPSSRFVSSFSTFIPLPSISPRISLRRLSSFNQWKYATWGTSHFPHPFPPFYLDFQKLKIQIKIIWVTSCSDIGGRIFQNSVFSHLLWFLAPSLPFSPFYIKLLQHTSSFPLFIFFLLASSSFNIFCLLSFPKPILCFF